MGPRMLALGFFHVKLVNCSVVCWGSNVSADSNRSDLLRVQRTRPADGLRQRLGDVLRMLETCCRHHRTKIQVSALRLSRCWPITAFAAEARFEIEDHVEDLHSLIHSLRMFDAALVGHDVGGKIAVACSRRHPQDVRSVTLVSPRNDALEDETRILSALTPASLALRELAEFPVIRNLIGWRFRRAPKDYRDRLFEDFSDLNPELHMSLPCQPPLRRPCWSSRRQSLVLRFLFL